LYRFIADAGVIEKVSCHEDHVDRVLQGEVDDTLESRLATAWIDVVSDVNVGGVEQSHGGSLGWHKATPI
jgi:hypothetical protein